jgi:hypothetical protein
MIVCFEKFHSRVGPVRNNYVITLLSWYISYLNFASGGYASLLPIRKCVDCDKYKKKT